ncbi:MAG: aspartyl protease family protein [Chloroflexota bacterium]
MENEVRKSHRARNIIIAAVVVAALLAGFIALELSLFRDDQEAGLAALEGTSLDESTLPVTVPFSFVAGHIVVEATFEDGEEPVALILDTGAPTILSDELADRVGGDVAGHMITAAIDGTTVTEEIVPVAELRLGDATFTDVGSIKGFLEPDNPLSCISSNGLIGASLMKEAVWQIDYGAKQLTIAPSVDGLDNIDGAIALGFDVADPASPSPRISLLAGDASLTFLVDTGSDGSLTINPDDLAGIGMEVDPSGPALGLVASGAAGSYDARLLFANVDLQLGDLQLDGFPVATIDSLQAGQGNIGNAFLSNYIVTIDWPQGDIYFEPVSDDARPPAPPAAKIGWDGERITVGSVVEGSDVAEAGLAIGQLIASVDGQDVSAATRDDFCELSVAGQPGDQYAITIDGGQSYQIGPVEGFYDPLQNR